MKFSVSRLYISSAVWPLGHVSDHSTLLHVSSVCVTAYYGHREGSSSTLVVMAKDSNRKHDYPNFRGWMLDLEFTEEAYIPRIAESLNTLNSRINVDVYLWQPSHPLVLQEDYWELKQWTSPWCSYMKRLIARTIYASKYPPNECNLDRQSGSSGLKAKWQWVIIAKCRSRKIVLNLVVI